ncbi:MAG TPA: extracellular solute-binding protein [Firmicutes bacterium]|nr:extracellular solute-binding protein [Bacillota bacterium]
MRKRKKACSLVSCLAVAAGMLGAAGAPAAAASAAPQAEWLAIPPEDVAARYAVEDGLALEAGDSVEITLDIPREGEYRLALVYRQDEYPAFGNTGELVINGEERAGFNLGGVWYDEQEEPQLDRYGNEVVSGSAFVQGAVTQYLSRETDYYRLQSTYLLKEGANTLALTVSELPVTVYELIAVQPAAYSGLSGTAEKNGRQVAIQAEDYVWKSDSYIHAGNAQDADVTPYEVERKRLNVLDGSTFDTHRQKVVYQFYVEQEGDYRIALRYNQDSKKGMSVYRTIAVDGRVPDACFESVSFAYTGLDYVTQTVTDGDGEAWIHLTQGWHTLSVIATAAPVAAYQERLTQTLEEISAAGVEVKMITGGQNDENRTWNIEEYLPTIVDDLNRWADELDAIYGELEQLAGQKPSFASALPKSAQYLRSAASSPRTLPSKTTKIFEGSGSVAQMIGDLITPLLQQQLTLDQLFVYSADQPAEEYPGLFQRILNGIQHFLLSFSADYNGFADSGLQEDALDVWVNRPLMAVETLQMLADASFTPATGIPVKVTIMPSEDKLTLANAAQETPDIAMGLSLSKPYELGLRGAVADLYEFDDFLDYYGENYDLRLLIPLWVDGKMSGVVESRNFQVLFYRKDILERLGLEVPDTWEDVKQMMPELKRNGMNFHVALASHTGNKPIATTSYYFVQNGAELYSSDGMTTAINQEKGQEAFELLTDLFNVYSLPVTTENFFNSFRYGRIPIGISNLDTYIRLKNAAPEIAGLWDIALSPGIEDEQGVIHRDQTSAGETAVIMQRTDQKQEAWAFLKWWLSTDVQEEYGFIMQTKFGPSFIWNTANEEAFRSVDIEKRHMDVIFGQWEWTYEVPLHPASYILERELSNAWNDVVVKKKEVRSSLDKAVINIDREIERKLQEFGYVKNGEMVQPYRLATLERIQEGGGA